MLEINNSLPVKPAFTSSISNNKPTRESYIDNNKKSTRLDAALAGLAILGIAGTICASKSKSNIFKELEKHGLEIKNGLIVSSKTGEHFTGTLKFNSKAYSLEKTTVSYIDGKTIEYLCHNLAGKEKSGIFFKEGKPFIKIGNITRNSQKQFYPIYHYNEKGVAVSHGDGAADLNTSVFETIRNSINKK